MSTGPAWAQWHIYIDPHLFAEFSILQEQFFIFEVRPRAAIFELHAQLAELIKHEEDTNDEEHFRPHLFGRVPHRRLPHGALHGLRTLRAVVFGPARIAAYLFTLFVFFFLG